jgi:DNA repair exonuclease SbcCD ATPase subunit
LILSQLETVKVSLDKAGIDTRTYRGDWVGAIKELCQPKAQALSAVKEELADVSSARDQERKGHTEEKAAKEAAQKELSSLKLDASVLELDNKQMKIEAEGNERRAIRYAENASSVSREEVEAAVLSDFTQRLEKYDAEMDAYHESKRATLKREIHELEEKNAYLERDFWHEVTKEVDRRTTAETEKLKKTKNTMKRKLAATEADLSTAACTIKMHEITIDQLKKKLGDEVAQKVGKEEDAIERSKKLQEQLKEEKTASKALEERLTTAEGTIDGKNNEISPLNKKISILSKT